MSKMSKAIAVLGVVAGLGVAALPLSTYAASKNAQVQVQVDGAISINLVAPATETNADPVSFDPATGLLDLDTIQINAAPVSGSMGVQVATNNSNGYELTIKAAGTTDMVGSGDAEGFTIPANASLDATHAGWAFKGGNITSLTAISTSEATLKSTTGAISGSETDAAGKKAETTDVTFSVSADTSTHEGVYTGTVIFTATAK